MPGDLGDLVGSSDLGDPTEKVSTTPSDELTQHGASGHLGEAGPTVKLSTPGDELNLPAVSGHLENLGDLGQPTVKVSAPGKVILHGEHAVVYGKLAIAASLDLRTTVTLHQDNSSKLQIYLKNLQLQKTYSLKDLNDIFNIKNIPLVNEEQKYIWTQPENINHDLFLKYILKSFQLNGELYAKSEYLSLAAFFYLFGGILGSNGAPLGGLSVCVESDLSLGSGTGSSASFVVSLAGAFTRLLTVKVPHLKITTNPVKETTEFTQSELALISNWAYCAEKIIHGNPSGIDNTICTFGSMVSFRKGSEPMKVKTSADIRGILVDTRVPKNTSEMVHQVLKLKEKHPKVVEHILESMAEVANEALENFVCLGMLDRTGTLEDIENCYKNLNELSDVNHALLRALNVSHAALEEVVSILKGGGLHGKLTGAGGGGYAVALVAPSHPFTDLDLVCQELNRRGFSPLVTRLGGHGLTELADVNHALLRALNVSHAALEEVVTILRGGGLHGKLTGAGGGGYAVALVAPSHTFTDLDLVCQELNRKGFSPLVTRLGGPGFTVHTL